MLAVTFAGLVARARLMAVAASLAGASVAACASSAPPAAVEPAPATASSLGALDSTPLGVSTSSLPPTSQAAVDEFTEARERWAAAGLVDYVLSFDIESQSRFQGRQWITVIDGVPQHTEFRIGPGATIADWFAYIGDTRDAAAKFVVTFDDALGFPTVLDVDTDAIAIDDEFRISNVVVLPGGPIVELSADGADSVPEQLANDTPPYGSGTKVGVGYEYVLYVHCGVEWARIDGSWWITSPPRTDGSGNPPAGWGNPFDDGLLYLSDQNTADYQRLFGDSIRFTRAELSSEPTGCD